MRVNLAKAVPAMNSGVTNHLINSPNFDSQGSNSPGKVTQNVKTPALKQDNLFENPNNDFAISVHNLREYKGPVVSFLDDDSDYYG